MPREANTFIYQKNCMALASVAQLVGVSSQRRKSCGFNSQSEYIPRLWVQSPVGAHMKRQPIHVSLSHQCFSLSPQKAMKKCPQVKIKTLKWTDYVKMLGKKIPWKTIGLTRTKLAACSIWHESVHIFCCSSEHYRKISFSLGYYNVTYRFIIEDLEVK